MNRASSVLSLFAAGVLGLAVVGCTHERPKELPGTAVLAVEGDKTLNYLAPADGMVTVYDARADKTVYSGEIKKGQNVMVDTSNNRITIDGKTVSDQLGHGLDVSQNVYTQAGIQQQKNAVNQLDDALHR